MRFPIPGDRFGNGGCVRRGPVAEYGLVLAVIDEIRLLKFVHHLLELVQIGADAQPVIELQLPIGLATRWPNEKPAQKKGRDGRHPEPSRPL